MGSITTYFFDTYALYEIIEGNNNYKPYINNIAMITTKLNLMELHYGLLLKYGKAIADKYYKELIRFAVKITDEIIMNSNELKTSFKKRKLSYVDCIGYTIALQKNIKFLTGDKEFQDLKNVEFVK